MIKMILAIGHINYDKLLNNMLEMAKQHPEQMGGVKLPPFTGQMLKMLPARKKNEMVAQALNSNKGKVEPQIEQLLAPITGPIQLKNFDIQCGGKRDVDEVTLTVEFAGYDCGYVADHILPYYYAEVTAPAFLGEDYSGPTDLASVQSYIKAQDYKKAQFLIAKSMSVNKAYIMNLLQDKAKLAEIELQVNNLRLMMK